MDSRVYAEVAQGQVYLSKKGSTLFPCGMTDKEVMRWLKRHYVSEFEEGLRKLGVFVVSDLCFVTAAQL